MKYLLHIIGFSIVSLTSQIADAGIIKAKLYSKGGRDHSIYIDHLPSNGWSIQKYKNLIQVRFPEDVFQIEVPDSIVDLLQDKVSQIEADVRNGDTFLRLTLSCLCDVVMMRIGNATLQLSVVTVNDDRAASIATELAPDRAPIPRQKQRSGINLQGERNAPALEIDVANVRTKILRQLVRAAEVGLINLEDRSALDLKIEKQKLSLRPENSPQTVSFPRTANKTYPTSQPTMPITDQAEQALSEQLQVERAETNRENVETEIEFDTKEISIFIPDTIYQESNCFPSEVFAFPETRIDASLQDMLSSTMSSLLGEFDFAQSEVALEAAKIYIAADLPEEASVILTEFSGVSSQTKLYLEIVDALVGRHVGVAAYIMRPDCTGDQAIWRAFAKSQIGDHEGALEDEKLSGRALDSLPLTLREKVARRLGLSAVALGLWDEAKRFEAVAIRSGDDKDVVAEPTAILSAEIAGWMGNDTAAISVLSSARFTGYHTADLATVVLAERVLRSPDFVTTDLTSLRLDLAAIAHRMRGDTIGIRAFENEAKIVYRTEGRDAVVELLSLGVVTGLLPEEQYADLLTRLLTRSPLSELSRPLGIVYLEMPQQFQSALENESFRQAIVRSLATLGLPKLALTIARPRDMSDQEVSSALVEALVQEGDAKLAMDIAQNILDIEKRKKLLFPITTGFESMRFDQNRVAEFVENAENVLNIEDISRYFERIDAEISDIERVIEDG